MNIILLAKDVIKLKLLKGRAYTELSGWAPNATICTLVRESLRNSRDRYIDEKTYIKEPMWAWRYQLEWCDHEPRNALIHRNLGKERKEFSPTPFGGSTTLLTPWFQTLSFQNCEGINFCCFAKVVAICYGSPKKLIHLMDLYCNYSCTSIKFCFLVGYFLLKTFFKKKSLTIQLNFIYWVKI